MHRFSINYFVAPMLMAFGTLLSGSSRAQQSADRKPPAVDLSPATVSFDEPTVGTIAALSPYIEAPPLPSNDVDPAGTAFGGPAVNQQQTAPPAKAERVQPQQSPTDPYTPGQTKRILGVIPNFRAVSADVKLPPQSVKEKFVTASQDSFDYSSTVIPALLAVYDLGINSVPQFGTGGVAFGRYLWHTTADQTIENYMVEFVVPVITHEDTRYYTLGHGSVWKRTSYALSRAVITRSDSGKEVFNVGEIVGAGASAGISDLYYPAAQRTLSDTATGWGLDVGIDAATFVFKEFWPDINHKLFHDSQ